MELLDKLRFRKDLGKYWFGKRMIDEWSKFPSYIISARTVKRLKK